MARSLNENASSEEALMNVTSIAIGALSVTDSYRSLTLGTSRGDVLCKFFGASGAKSAVLVAGEYLSKEGGSLSGLFSPMFLRLTQSHIVVLCVKYRDPFNLVESALDVLAGIVFLNLMGIERVALMGHAFSAAVISQATLVSPSVVTLVLLSAQSYGAAEAISSLRGRSILFLHGSDDTVLPPACSEYLFALASQPKSLILIPRAEHDLKEGWEEVQLQTHAWFLKTLV